MRRALILVAATAVMLAGCGGKKSGRAASAAADGPASAAAPDESAPGPMRKAGLWTITRIHDGKPAGGATKVCVDAGTDAGLNALGGGLTRSLCADLKSRRNPDGSWSFSNTCQLGPAGMTRTSGSARGDFASHYEVHSESDTESAQIASLNGHHVTDLSAVYGGACPPDMQPGDVLLPNGMKVNPQKMMAGAHPAGVGGDQ
ncbi:hypothetical protein ACO2Q3_05370 [Caulobacter sp. KR2-114]|uniref:hypothetical protein n=1 Tax=Caulobacter sp. KR2-114 TaxID=3400912 RepID=UPI003BFB9EED